MKPKKLSLSMETLRVMTDAQAAQVEGAMSWTLLTETTNWISINTPISNKAYCPNTTSTCPA